MNFRQVMVLPFLSPGQTAETFSIATSWVFSVKICPSSTGKAWEVAIKFFHPLNRRGDAPQIKLKINYVWRQWTRNPVFPITSWSVFTCPPEPTTIWRGGSTAKWESVSCWVSSNLDFLFFIELFQEASIPMVTIVFSHCPESAYIWERIVYFGRGLLRCW